jgi:hypothetical protein
MKNLCRLFKITLIITIITSIIGCNNSPKPVVESSKPTWIVNPMQNGKVGAVGVAGRTYDQRISTQRKLAIQRALDELALQQGVKVELSMQKKEHVTNNIVSTKMDTSSKYKTTNSNAITAHIEDVWQDKITGELYIWLVLDK